MNYTIEPPTMFISTSLLLLWKQYMCIVGIQKLHISSNNIKYCIPLMGGQIMAS